MAIRRGGRRDRLALPARLSERAGTHGSGVAGAEVNEGRMLGLPNGEGGGIWGGRLGRETHAIQQLPWLEFLRLQGKHASRSFIGSGLGRSRYRPPARTPG